MALAAIACAALVPIGGRGSSERGVASKGDPGGEGGTVSDVAGRADELLRETGVSYRRHDSLVEGSVREAAAALLEERRAGGDCVLVRSGYLDLFGETWGCVLQGEGWVEVCVVSGDGDDTGSSVDVWRMGAEDVAYELTGLGDASVSLP